MNRTQQLLIDLFGRDGREPPKAAMEAVADPISNKDMNILRLIYRSPDVGSGWRQTSSQLWPLIVTIGNSDMVELDHENKRIRLTDECKNRIFDHFLS